MASKSPLWSLVAGVILLVPSLFLASIVNSIVPAAYMVPCSSPPPPKLQILNEPLKNQ